MRLPAFALMMTVVATVSAESSKPWRLETEVGPLWFGRNQLASPGNTGSRFAFRDLTGRGGFITSRTTLTYERETGPGFRLLYAPLRVDGTGRFPAPTTFEGQTFNSTDPTSGLYQFNSYRLTYRNRWKQGPRSDWRVGFTLKARDAEVRLSQNGNTARTKNFGLVPLLHVYGEERLGKQWTFILDFDGAAATQGRALDLGLKLAYQVNSTLGIHAGVRMLEGGVDNTKNYNLVRLDSLLFGVGVRF